MTIRLQTSDVSLYTLYNTFIMFPDPAAIGTRRYRGLGNGRGLATVAPPTISVPYSSMSVLTVQPRSQACVGLTVQPEMADHDLVCSWRSGPLVVL